MSAQLAVALDAVRGSRARALLARWPWWVKVLAVYGCARLVTAVILMVVASHQVASLWTPASPSYLQYTGLMWDGSWYQDVAEHGYPRTLPLNSLGQVRQNAWAFYPLFPVLARGLMVVTGAPWQDVAPILAIVLGAAAMIVIYRLVERGAPRAVAERPRLPLVTVALVSFFPTAVVLQSAYTESLALLLIAGVLLALVERRYSIATVLVLALGLTRAVALPMALVVLVHAYWRWRAARAGSERLARRDVVGLGGLLAACAVAGLGWQFVCGAVTGVSDGYLQTQAAWRGRPDVVPFVPWLDIARWRFGEWGPFVLVAVFALFTALLLSRPARRLGVELRTWPAAYLLYLVAVIEPGTSLARFLLLAFPFAAITAGLAARPAAWRRVYLVLVLVVMSLLQFGWVWTLWRFVPPSGWPP